MSEPTPVGNSMYCFLPTEVEELGYGGCSTPRASNRKSAT